MTNPAERWKIEYYLSLIRNTTLETLIIPGRKDPNSKTALCMKVLGYTTEDVLQVLQQLVVEDYSEGPKADLKGREHDLWVFGKTIDDRQIYIKVTAFPEEDGITTICVSFHEAEREMTFPYRKVHR